MKSKTLITWNGHTDTIKGWARRLGWTDSRIHHRIQKFGLSKRTLPMIFDPVSHQFENSKKHYLTFKGKTLCIRDWAKKLGMTRKTIESRIHKKWPVEEILNPNHVARCGSYTRAKRYTIDGVSLTKREWAERIGTNRSTLENRIYNYKRRWGVVEALTTPAMKNEDSIRNASKQRRENAKRRQLAKIGIIV